MAEGNLWYYILFMRDTFSIIPTVGTVVAAGLWAMLLVYSQNGTTAVKYVPVFVNI